MKIHFMFFLFLKKSLFCALLFLLYLKNCIPHLHFTPSRSDFSWGKQQPCATTHRYSFLSAAGSPIWPLDLSSPSPHFLHPLTSCRPAARPSRPYATLISSQALADSASQCLLYPSITSSLPQTVCPSHSAFPAVTRHPVELF